jgi:hypothetical protein
MGVVLLDARAAHADEPGRGYLVLLRDGTSGSNVATDLPPVPSPCGIWAGSAGPLFAVRLEAHRRFGW